MYNTVLSFLPSFNLSTYDQDSLVDNKLNLILVMETSCDE